MQLEYERKQAELSEFFGLSKKLISKSKHVERHVERSLKTRMMLSPLKLTKKSVEPKTK